MHIPNYYKNEDIEEVKSFLIENSFGILINQNGGKLMGTHIPMELETNDNGKDVLVGHISKVNPQWNVFEQNQDVLAIFSGPHTYISSSWYEKENVPTWNYIAVHVYGKIKMIEGEELLNSLKRLVNKYEQNSKNPVSVDRMSPKILKQINGIIGFEIEITEIQAAYKLSQNRNDVDHHQITEELKNTEDAQAIAVAKAMKNQRS